MGSSSSEKPLTPRSSDPVVLSGISQSFDWLSPTRGQITHIFLTRAPLVLTRKLSSFDLHVLGTPPAFVLSQNQTLQLKTVKFNNCLLYINVCFLFETKHTKLFVYIFRRIVTCFQNLYNYSVFKEPQQRQLF